MKLLADILGYAVLGISIVTAQFPKKMQILFCSMLSLALGSLSVLLKDGMQSVVMLNGVAIINVLINMWHVSKNEEAGKKEKIIFGVLYFVAGILMIKKPLDVISLLGAMLYVCFVFQTDEQRMRLFSLANVTAYFAYYALLGSTLVYSQLYSMTSLIIALFRYSKFFNKNMKKEEKSL